MKTLCVMDKNLFADVYPQEVINTIVELAGDAPKLYSADEIRANPELLRGVEYIFGSWGSPCFDAELLAHADKLKAVFFAAGTVKPVVSDAFWKRGLRITSAAAANAVPVAEFALGEILLSLKRFFYHNKLYQGEGVFRQDEFAGLYKSHVGLISYGMIAKHLAKLLKAFDLIVHVYSPELDEKSAAQDGLIFTPLDELFRVCDVVSVHTPLLPQTRGMITRNHIASMKRNATLINTARGAVIDEDGLTAVLAERKDITALLDVTAVEPQQKGSALSSLDNVILTPHIAGSCNTERGRCGELAAMEFARFLKGEPLMYEVTADMLGSLA